MEEIQCLLCDSLAEKKSLGILRAFDCMIECQKCGLYEIPVHLLNDADRIRRLKNRYLVSSYCLNAKIHSAIEGILSPGSLALRLNSLEHIESIINKCPKSPFEKSRVLLDHLVRLTPSFGTEVLLGTSHEAMSYSSNRAECFALAELLHESKFIKLRPVNGGHAVLVTAQGYETAQKPQSPLTIFISSTCFDLLDLRDELGTHLESLGHIVRLSEDFERFEVPGHGNSIRNCLHNVESSDVVFCIVDRRYGGVIPEGEWQGKSATHVEVLHANEKRIPIYSFIRDKSIAEIDLIKSESETKWVEPKNPASRKKWNDLYHEIIKLRANTDQKNWYDSFSTVVDLKKIASKRLADFAKNRPF